MSEVNKYPLRHGDTVYVTDLCYDNEYGELEIGYRDLEFWSGISMSKEDAIRIMWKSQRDGFFFYKNVRHIMVEYSRDIQEFLNEHLSNSKD